MSSNQTTYRVRFNLGAGTHFMHWKVDKLKGSKIVETQYYDPKIHQLSLFDCTPINRPKIAYRVYQEGVKDVCGWVKCRSYSTDPIPLRNGREQLMFNPIIFPHWRRSGDWTMCDNEQFKHLTTVGNKLYIESEV
jgi:hypothetical protein